MPACFANPLQSESVSFLADVLKQRRRVLLPVSAAIGAYHIANRYLGVPRVAVRRVLGGLLDSGSPALYPSITPRLAGDALEYASSYGVESWDGYLIALAKATGSGMIYSLDRELGRVKEITVASPFSEEAVRRYHTFLQSRLRKQKAR